jgi:acyl carrier protein
MLNAMQARIVEILVVQFKVERSILHADTTFESLHFDSLVLIELALILEAELGIMLGDGELTDEMTIGEVAELTAARGAVH